MTLTIPETHIVSRLSWSIHLCTKTDPSHELLYQVAVLFQMKNNLSTLWPGQSSDESLYVAAAQFSGGRIIQSNGY